MAELLYKLGIALYSGIAWLLASFGHTKAKQLVEGRSRSWKLLEDFQAQPKKPTAWFHCASLGEFEQGRPVLEAFRKQYPHYRVLLTFFSPSGYEIRKNYPHADLVCYLPADSKNNAKRFLSLVNPEIAFFVKYEFWHYFLNGLKDSNCPTILFASIFRPQQVFFKPWGGFQRNILRFFQHIFVQNQDSKELLNGIGLHHTSIGNDTRFDRVYELCQAPQSIEEAALFSRGFHTGIIGSAWPADIEVIAPSLKGAGSHTRFIIAPHEIDEGTLQQIEKMLMPLSVLRFSALRQKAGSPANAQVLLIDNIGMLSSLYQYGDWAYIGGAFGKGLHNTLEAATFGLMVIFGPKYQKFQEAIGLIDRGAAHSIKNAAEFQELFDTLQKNREWAQNSGAKSAAYVKANLGGTAQLMSYIQEHQLV